MKDEDVKIGMRVVPFQKTTWRDLSKSDAWKKGKERGYLYVTFYDREEEAWVLDQQGKYFSYSGDFFNACDFEPYIEEKRVEWVSGSIKIRMSTDNHFIVDAGVNTYIYDYLEDVIDLIKEIYTS